MNDLPFLTTVSDYMRQLAHIEDFYKHKIIKHSIKVSDEIIIATTGIDKKELEKIKLTKN